MADDPAIIAFRDLLSAAAAGDHEATLLLKDIQLLAGRPRPAAGDTALRDALHYFLIEVSHR